MAGTLRRFDSEIPEAVEETVIQDQVAADTVVHHFDDDFNGMPTSELGTAEHELGKIPTLTLALEPEAFQGTKERSFASLVEPRKPLAQAARPRKNSGATELVRSRMKQTFFLSSGIILGIVACLSALYLFKTQDLTKVSLADLKAHINLPKISHSENLSSISTFFEKKEVQDTLHEVALIKVDTAEQYQAAVEEQQAQGLQEVDSQLPESNLNDSKTDLTTLEVSNPLPNQMETVQLQVSVVDSQIPDSQSSQSMVSANIVKPVALDSETDKSQAANTEEFLHSKPVAITERRFLHFQNSYRSFGSSFKDAPIAVEKIAQDKLSVPELKQLGDSNRMLDDNTGIEWQSGWEIDKPEQNLRLGESYIKYLKSNGAEKSKLEFKTIQGKPSSFLKALKPAPAAPGSITRYDQN